MRLLFVHERLGTFGGAEANILATAEALQLRGHTVGLAFGQGASHSETEANRVFPELYPLPSTNGSAALNRALADFRPDVVYLHKFADPEILLALLTCGRPVVRMVHDHDLYCMRGYKYNPLSRHICHRAASAYCVFPCGACVARNTGTGFPLRWVSYQAKRREIDLNKGFHRMLVASAYMKEELLRNGFAAQRIEIHAPVPRATPPTDLPSFSSRNLIIYAGQIIRGKGVDVLLKALARVKAPFEGVILGSGSQRAHCERLTERLDLQNRVTFAGFVPQARLADYYRDASLAVISSLWPEPFGATGLEAMRCGLPVVGFEAGGIREWLRDGETGFLVPWGNKAKFATAVERLLLDKTLARRLGENGRALANDHFSFANYIDGLELLFSRAAVGPAMISAPLQEITL